MRPVKSINTYFFHQPEGDFDYLVEVTKYTRKNAPGNDIRISSPGFSSLVEHGQTFYFHRGCDIAFVLEGKELNATSLTIRDFALYDRVMAVANDLVAMDVRFCDVDYENSSPDGRWVMAVNCSSEIEIIDDSLSDVLHKAIHRTTINEVAVKDIIPLLELARYSAGYFERLERFIDRVKKGKK